MNGNGVDRGAIQQMLMSMVQAQLQRGRQISELRAEMQAEIGRRAETNDGFANLRSEVSGPRQQATTRHPCVLGDGVRIRELDARLRRIEEHLKLPPAASAERSGSAD